MQHTGATITLQLFVQYPSNSDNSGLKTWTDKHKRECSSREWTLPLNIALGCSNVGNFLNLCSRFVRNVYPKTIHAVGAVGEDTLHKTVL